MDKGKGTNVGPFDSAEREYKKEEAISRADRSADPFWKMVALEEVLSVAQVMETFTSDDIWEKFIDDCGQEFAFQGTHNLSAMGPVMRNAASLGYCEFTGVFIHGKLAKQHSKPLRIWRSLLVNGDSNSMVCPICKGAGIVERTPV